MKCTKHTTAFSNCQNFLCINIPSDSIYTIADIVLHIEMMNPILSTTRTTNAIKHMIIVNIIIIIINAEEEISTTASKSIITILDPFFRRTKLLVVLQSSCRNPVYLLYLGYGLPHLLLLFLSPFIKIIIHRLANLHTNRWTTTP